MSANDDTLARLTFNATAMREYIGDDAKGVRLKIERNAVTFRPANSLRGVDVIAIERRPRGTIAELARGMLSRRLLQRLFKAGLNAKQPYFVLEPVGRGWFGIDHLSDQQAPIKQPLMVVSDFVPPPTAIDMTAWQRFLRLVTAGRSPIPEETWKSIDQMVRSAEQIVARKGRRTQERDAAERLLGGVERNAPKLLAWGDRQPEYATAVTDLLTRLGIELPEAPAAEVAVEVEAIEEAPEQEAPEPPPEVPQAREAPPRRARRKSRGFRSPDPVPAEPESWVVDDVVEVTVVETVIATEEEPATHEAHGHEEVQAGEAQGSAGDPDDVAEPPDIIILGPPEEPEITDDTPDGVTETPEDEQTRDALDQKILSAWERFENLEPDISTERLMMMVADDTGADNPRQIEALKRAGWPVPYDED